MERIERISYIDERPSLNVILEFLKCHGFSSTYRTADGANNYSDYNPIIYLRVAILDNEIVLTDNLDGNNINYVNTLNPIAIQEVNAELIYDELTEFIYDSEDLFEQMEHRFEKIKKGDE